jgi:hypothetical protein
MCRPSSPITITSSPVVELFGTRLFDRRPSRRRRRVGGRTGSIFRQVRIVLVLGVAISVDADAPELFRFGIWRHRSSSAWLGLSR